MLLCALVNVWAVIGLCAEPDPKPQESHTWTQVRFHEGAFLLGFSADGKYVAAGGKGDVRVFAVGDGKEVVRMKVPGVDGTVYNAFAAAFAADGKHLITANTTDGKLRYWDLVTGKQMKEVELAGAKDAQWIVEFSPGASHVALRLKENIAVVDTKTGKVAVELEGAGPTETGGIKQMGGAFSPDGKRFAAGAGKGRIAVWDVATGKQLACSKARHATYGDFIFVRFSPDGRFLATGAGGPVNHPISVWDATTGELLTQPLKIEGFTTALAWTPDGTAVVTLDYPGVYATDVATGKRTHKFTPPGSGGLWGQPFYPSPDGKHLVFQAEMTTTDPDGKKRTAWGVYLAQMPAKKPALKGELTAAELDAIWADVATGNAFRREQQFPALAAAPGSAVPYLVKQVPVATAEEVKYLRELIADLGSDDAAKRKTATDRLTKRAHRYAPLFREALADAPAGTGRDGLAALVDLAKTEPPADLRADLRAVELLARLSTPDAVKHLKALAAGAPQSRVTVEAKVAVERVAPKP